MGIDYYYLRASYPWPEQSYDPTFPVKWTSQFYTISDVSQVLYLSNLAACDASDSKETLSSPRVGPKGQRAESSRAVTGRWCPHSGRGEDFLTGQPDFFTETAVTPERKVEKSFPRWEINRHAEG